MAVRTVNSPLPPAFAEGVNHFQLSRKRCDAIFSPSADNVLLLRILGERDVPRGTESELCDRRFVSKVAVPGSAWTSRSPRIRAE